MRLDKFLTEVGLGSRTEVKALLKKKLITVNGQVITSPKEQVDELADQVSYQGEPLLYEDLVYYLLNKPAGVISATEDSKQRTVLDLLDDTARHKQVFPVGRLDKDTTGLLLLTNNGQLAHALLSPKKHVDKTYEADVDGLMDEADVAAFAAGITLSDHQCLPAVLELLDMAEQTSRVRITIREGKFHQVKRMVASRGKTVTRLKRISMGPLNLPDDLPEGAYRRLTADEVTALLALV